MDTELDVHPRLATMFEELSDIQMTSSCVRDEPTFQETRYWRNRIAYWILGLCNNYGYVVMLSAAHDILSENFDTEVNSTTLPTNNSSTRNCNIISTGAILLADILPSLFIKLMAPFLPFYIHTRVACVIALSSTGFLLVAFSTVEWLTILGVIATSFASGLGELTFLAYTFGYDHLAILMWSSGTGGAGIFGAGSYAGLTSLGVTSSNSLLIMLIVPGIMAITFWLLLQHPTHHLLCTVKTTAASEEEAAVTATIHSNNNQPPLSNKTLLEKLKTIPLLLQYMVPLGAVYLFEYFINQGIFELISFPDFWLDHSEQYRWLQLDYQIGVFLSRSSASFFKLEKIWIMAVLQFINAILFTFEAVYFFIPTFWLVFLLTLWEGLLGGAAYVNTYYRISKEVALDKQEFSLSITTVSDAIGIGLAGILAIPIHNIICDLPRTT